MLSYEWIQHKGKRIFYMDLAAQTTEELKDVRARIEPVVEKEPQKSILCLCNVKGGKFNNEITEIFKEFAKHNEPYMKITALIGVEGLKKIIYSGVIMFSGRKNLVLKESRQEALDWLAEQ